MHGPTAGSEEAEGGERWPLFKQLAGARPPVARRGARGKDVGGEWGEGLEMAPLHTKGLGCSGSKAEGWILRWPGRTGPREGLTLTMAPVAMARVNPSSTASHSARRFSPPFPISATAPSNKDLEAVIQEYLLNNGNSWIFL